MESDELPDRTRRTVEGMARYVCASCGHDEIHYYADLETPNARIHVCADCGSTGTIPEEQYD